MLHASKMPDKPLSSTCVVIFGSGSKCLLKDQVLRHMKLWL